MSFRLTSLRNVDPSIRFTMCTNVFKALNDLKIYTTGLRVISYSISLYSHPMMYISIFLTVLGAQICLSTKPLYINGRKIYFAIQTGCRECYLL